MTDDHNLDVPVYHAPPASAGPVAASAPLRPFYIDLYDEDSDDYVHAYFGVTEPGGATIIRSMTCGGIISPRSAESFARRLCGEVVWT
ncbi:hypothetical protein [Marinitenerispora sediminis]|uniref:Uncharacterized protein n=1 Tax=Marinitenerispora sediminis TaxID=1931232 RepID=A0A368T917_9ACTN|nr:hypothetical protein [Marinitenerispora sediminis]RCV52360.1 hypothetical protein DEF28_13115 [Marinitenerispora sediminis]RCV60925.1 hypothetical protein DEF24_05525 [Marinitenerispora sediminis]RCV62216.1 hypothetical protein DEF23_00485 [Marinitenerispora sediminis]